MAACHRDDETVITDLLVASYYLPAKINGMIAALIALYHH